MQVRGDGMRGDRGRGRGRGTWAGFADTPRRASRRLGPGVLAGPRPRGAAGVLYADGEVPNNEEPLFRQNLSKLMGLLVLVRGRGSLVLSWGVRRHLMMSRPGAALHSALMCRACVRVGAALRTSARRRCWGARIDCRERRGGGFPSFMFAWIAMVAGS